MENAWCPNDATIALFNVQRAPEIHKNMSYHMLLKNNWSIAQLTTTKVKALLVVLNTLGVLNQLEFAGIPFHSSRTVRH